VVVHGTVIHRSGESEDKSVENISINGQIYDPDARPTHRRSVWLGHGEAIPEARFTAEPVETKNL
jgi:hypothetical protein